MKKTILLPFAILLIFSSFPSVMLGETSSPSQASGKIKSTESLSSSSQQDTSGLNHLNSASEKELQQIKGIGPALAKRIIAGRPYENIDDLLKIKGIGRKKLETVRGQMANLD